MIHSPLRFHGMPADPSQLYICGIFTADCDMDGLIGDQ